MSSSRTICSPDYPTLMKDQHKHLCNKCGTCWRHPNDIEEFCDVSEGKDAFRKAFDEAHSCPKCGTKQSQKHYSESEEKARKEGLARLPARSREIICIINSVGPCADPIAIIEGYAKEKGIDPSELMEEILGD